MLTGAAWKYGDNVDTDVIIPARYLTATSADELKAHCLEDLDPGFAARVSPGDIIVAGGNFGCGSSREHAPLAIKAAGVSCVIARSFARLLFRNSFNIGLPLLECSEAVDGIEASDQVEVDLGSGRIRNLTRGTEFQARALPEFMQTLVADGGLIENVKKRMAAGDISTRPVAASPEADETEKKPERGSRMKELENEKATGKDSPWEEDAAEADTSSATPTVADALEQGEEDEEEEEPETGPEPGGE